jgi:hypothetical protein
MFGVPFILQFIVMGIIFFNVSKADDPDTTIMINTLTLFPVITIIYSGLFFGWFWSIAIGLQNMVPEGVKMKVNKFKTFFFIPLIYIVLISLIVGFTASGLFVNGNVSGSIVGGVLIMVILVLHLFSMFCIFYSLYFVSKTIKTVELQREVNFGDFIGEFFMLWFYPIGIWIVQPRINKMAEIKSKT